VRDSKAANGRIIDGQIIEVSLVDRPANPSAKLILAKSVDGEPTLIQVEEAHEYNAPLPSEIFKHGDHDQSDHNPNAGGGSSSSGNSDPDSAERDRMEAARDNSLVANSASAVSSLSDAANDLRVDLEKDFDLQGAEAADRAIDSLNSAHNAIEDAKGSENLGSHSGQLEDAVRDLEFAQRELDSIDSDDAGDLADEVGTALEEIESYLDELYGRDQEKSLTNKRESKMKRIERIKAMAKSLTADQILELKKALDEPADAGMAMNGESKAVPSRDEMVERYMAARKALDDVASEAKSHGYDDIDKEYGETAEEETAEGPAVAAETAEEEVREAEEQKPADETKAAEESEDEEEKSEDEEKKKVSKDDESEDDEAIKSLVEKAVKSAMDMVKGEIDTLRAEKESAVEKSVKLETELTTALSKSVAGGPKRTAIAQGAVSNEYLAKGLAYKAKADATTDPVLAKGYREIANELLAKADSKTTTK
jgi:hypothetical protein